MTITDIIIIIVLGLIIIPVIYFNFIKNRNKPCYGCSKAGICNLSVDEIKAKLREEYLK